MRKVFLLFIIAFVAVALIILITSTDHFSSQLCPKTRAESRKLWNDHVFWTRQYIVKYFDGLSGLDEATEKLMKNQEELGAFIDGIVPGSKDVVTKLLKEHIMDAVAILKTAKSKGDLGPDVSKWYENANVISSTLAKALDLSPETIRNLMYGHLKTTLDEATYHLSGDTYQERIAYAKVIKHIHMLSDYLISKVECKCANKGGEEITTHTNYFPEK